MKYKNKKILSHSEYEVDIDLKLSEIKSRLTKEDSSKELIELANELSNSELGRFLITNSGFNGYWTDVVVTYPERIYKNINFSSLDKTILETFPVVQATQERFNIFRNALQNLVKEEITMASIPCGFMRDLLQLDYSKAKNFKLIGIDLDSDSISQAKSLAKEFELLSKCEFKQLDAWSLNDKEQADVISSNGLNIYEPNEDRNIELFKNFHSYLKPGGTLITSFLTPPPTQDKNSEWDMSKIDEEALLMQKKIYMVVLEVKFNCYCSSDSMKAQMKKAGFDKTEIFYDKASIFPTIVASKKD
jgi:SAM-dependent methyltransferase